MFTRAFSILKDFAGVDFIPSDSKLVTGFLHRPTNPTAHPRRVYPCMGGVAKMKIIGYRSRGTNAMNHVTAERSIKKRWSCPFEYIMRSNDNRTKMFFLFCLFCYFFIAYICFLSDWLYMVGILVQEMQWRSLDK